MRRIAAFGDLVTHTRQQLECSAITKFGIEFSLDDIKHVSKIAPVIRQIVSAIFDQAHAQIADGEVRQVACPISPRWTVGGTPDQSVTVNGSVGIFMRITPDLSLCADHRAARHVNRIQQDNKVTHPASCRARSRP
jgi:hypothetical protein